MSEEQQHRLALPQGTRIRDFEFHRVLGYGGFGITYLGWNVALDIPVAIKEYLPADLATRESDLSVVPQTTQAASDFQWGLERFLDEARTLARFQHPNIVRVHHFFEAHSTAYIAMDYVEGEDLLAYLRRKGTLSEDELKGILYPLLDALEVIHRADFLHRDIKPGNIVLRDADGLPVLLDFGSARQAIGAKSRSVTSIVTPGYAPIEQYSSRGRQGAWTDIYALGGVCYRALTGQVPDDATDRMRDDPLVPVSQRCAGRVSGAFLSAIDGALSVDEGDRPQSVGAWREVMEGKAGEAQERARALVEAPKDAAGDATIVGRVEPAAPPSEPQKKTKSKLLFAVVLGVVALLVGGKMYIDHAEQVALERQQEQAVEKARLAAEQAEKERREQAALEKQRQEQEQAEKERREQAALEKQRQEQEQAEKERREQAALEKQRQEQEQAFVAAVGRMPHPGGMNKGETDLHTAARLNLPVLALSLLNQGAAVGAKDKDGWTPLHRAADADALAVAQVLLSNGAAVHAKDNNGSTPLHRAAYKDGSSVAQVLLSNGAAVDAKNKYGSTPLHGAAYWDGSSVAQVLLSNGAAVHAKDNNGSTPLHKAADGDGSSVAQVLLSNGAAVDAKNKYGSTPLHRAADGDGSSVAQVLLSNGAAVDAKDNKGRTPLQLADKDASSTAAVLRRYGGRR